MKQTTLKVILDTVDRVKVDRVKDRIAWALNRLNNKVVFDIQEEKEEYKLSELIRMVCNLPDEDKDELEKEVEEQNG